MQVSWKVEEPLASLQEKAGRPVLSEIGQTYDRPILCITLESIKTDAASSHMRGAPQGGMLRGTPGLGFRLGFFVLF